MIFAFGFFQAQDVEELQEGFFFSETSKNFFRVDIKKPYDYYKVSSCSDEAFFLHMDIDKAGKVTGLKITPRVDNSEGFLRDLKFAVGKIKKNWTPSKCNNVPVDSRIRIKLNFVTESIDV